MIYLTNTVGLNPGIVGTLIAVSKLLDGVTDIFFGSLIDKTHSKMGKARPWMLYGYIGCPVREKRDEIIILRTTKAEKNRIYEKMLGMGIRSLSAYIRKMALDGYCLNLDLPQLRRMAYLLQMCSNNLNQYAKVANENGRVYAADMEDLRQRLDELIDIGRQILSRLAEL